MIEEYFNYREALLNDSKDEDGFIQQSLLLDAVIPLMFESGFIDYEDYNNTYFFKDNLKVNGYMINESGERLQIFIVNENTLNETLKEDDLYISEKKEYNKFFNKSKNFILKSIKGELNGKIQDSDAIKPLVNKLSSSIGIEQFDVIEIFLISLTATVSFKGEFVEDKRVYFKDEKKEISYNIKKEKKSKELLIIKKLIDLNYLYDIIVSKGKGKPLVVNFKKTFGYSLEVLKAAKEENFESYLCVLKGKVLYDLYKRFSGRLLEKNVRSFLSFKGANKGIRKTIKEEPEKFIAYNNGLTITATKVKVFEKKKKMYIESLEDFQIVNGGQTTATIYFSKKDGIDISKVKVMAKINIAKESTEKELDELITNISKFSNTQSKVSNVDLRSRNPKLVTLKQLSERVITPSGLKWFFERSKGEYNTKILMIGKKRKAKIKNEYPPARRFSKEQLAKFYTAWGDKPYLVKKGGQKVFRDFLETIDPEDKNKEIEVDRVFYEGLISRIILFKSMEKIYGSGKNAIGQLRSAVIPYSLSIIYKYTSNGNNFNLVKIWKDEKLTDSFSHFLNELMILMNDLIKQYSISDDYAEYSKKEEFWNIIKECDEIEEFISLNKVKYFQYLIKNK